MEIHREVYRGQEIVVEFDGTWFKGKCLGWYTRQVIVGHGWCELTCQSEAVRSCKAVIVEALTNEGYILH